MHLNARLISSPLTAGALLLLLILPISACDDDDPVCPQQGVGQLEGHVLAAGQGQSVEVGARYLSGSQEGALAATTTSDTDGYYQMILPEGEYRLEIDPLQATMISGDMADTLHFSGPARRYDLLRGQARVTLNLPDEFNGDQVSLRLMGDYYASETVATTVADGLATFISPLLRPGSYGMRFSVPTESSFYLPGHFEEADGAQLHVDSSSEATYSLDLRPSFATISGQIHGSWLQDPQSALRAYLVNRDGTHLTGAYCQDDGSFRCRTFMPLEATVLLVWTFSEQWYGGSNLETATFLDFAAGDHLDGVEMTGNGLRASLHGPGAMFLYDPIWTLVDENGWEHEAYGYSSSGQTFHNLPDGRYYLNVSGACRGATWAPQWYGGAEVRAEATPIDLAGGQLVELDFDLVEGGRILGGMRDAEGEELAEQYYRLYYPDGSTVCSNWSQWFGYRMLFGGLPDGQYLVGAGVGDLGVWFHPGTLDPELATVFEISGHNTVEDVFWNLPASGEEVAP